MLYGKTKKKSRSRGRGIIKCRMVHMPGATILQPDLILCGGAAGGTFYIPQYFYAPRLDNLATSHPSCFFTIATGNEIEVRIRFRKSDLIKTCSDGSQLFGCGYEVVKGKLPSHGKYRWISGRFQLALYHHTNETGYNGIIKSSMLWSSAKILKGDGILENISYGYFTPIARMETEMDLLQIAMSSSANMYLLAVNAPLDFSFATKIGIPAGHPTTMLHSLCFWVDLEDLAPWHAWVKRPDTGWVYYEVVMPAIFRVGVLPGTKLSFDKEMVVRVPSSEVKRLEYIVVGDGDSHQGLAAPFHEEDTASVGKIEKMANGEDFFSFWKNNANRDLFSNRDIEYASISPLVA